ncbi:putative pentatricopeptide repeat-containing protein [Cinnamomum micranthum f. kanehirae]|uniref:Putative pentatricopeptide repeat-containing protein n=1 Tax=Cinnamomum micranthum f. kanehirae TaxID=337451 RepID=A0A3S3NEH3_9MAGN|nr:putative pentatricopeptide repeat-containing protein [Cinnamomum micranthum f. kanehirae]
MKSLKQAIRHHSHIIKNGILPSVFFNNQLIEIYCKNGLLFQARHLFDRMPERNVFTWNAIIAGYVKNNGLTEARSLFDTAREKDPVTYNSMISGYVGGGHECQALELFAEMHGNGTHIDEFTLTSMLNLAARMSVVGYGKQIHAYMMKTNNDSDCFGVSSLIDMYSKCGCFLDAFRVFSEPGERDLVSKNAMAAARCRQGELDLALNVFWKDMDSNDTVSWNTLISGCAQNGRGEMALELFTLMAKNGVRKNEHTFASVLSACSSLKALKHGKEIHACVLKNGLTLEFVHKWWLSGCLLEFRMKEKGVPDALILINVLSACAIQSALNHGKEIHTYILRSWVEIEEKLGSALVDMYAKCGEIKYSEETFKRITGKDRVLYNAMMGGFAHHGRVNETIRIFKDMLYNCIRPDAITFIALLSACRHAGLVEEGEKYFDSMIKNHGISPEIDHYSCIIDLLGRAGQLDKALLMIERMEVKPDAIIWGTFLNACKMNRNVELAREAEEKLLRMEEDNGARYVQLANTYAAKGEWSEMGRIRRKMREMEVKKHPGCSWVYVENKMKIFVSNDRLHPEAEATYRMLEALNAEMKCGEHCSTMAGLMNL